MFNTLIVDGPYLAHRSYDAPYKLTTSSGRDATMIHSFIRSLNSIRKQINPERIIIAWESPGTPSWRKEQNKTYKESRGRVDDQYIFQMDDLQKLLHLFGVEQYNSYGNEADDVIARLSISVNDLKVKYPIVIYTVDKDLMQLVGEECQVYNGKQFFDINKVKEKFFVYPEYIADLLALAGDKSDNIKGLDGFGFKKASQIINEEGHIEDITFNSCSRNIVWSERLKQRILENKKLTKLNFGCNLQKIPKEEINETIKEIIDKYELVKMKEKINEYKLLGCNNEKM